MKEKGIMVGRVIEGSIASEVGVEKGDRLISINGHAVNDILDYYFYIRDEAFKIELAKQCGDRWEIEIEKDFDQDLGMEFSSTGLERITRCANKCLFCFVDQMPGGMRESLYVKDDDYRLSFLQGSFITLTNISDKELKRIGDLRLSPLFVSVHATNPDLRKRIMGNPRAGNIMSQLEYLTGRGIEIHTQAVVCPGVNDGAELEKTVSDLAAMWPGISSLAIVPVGLTRSREGLYPVSLFSREEAARIVSRVKGWQNGCLETFGYPFVFASDEFYLLAGKSVPHRSRYADFPQTENGVGITRLFIDEWSRARKKLPRSLSAPLKILLVTGMLGSKVLNPVIDFLNRIENLQAGSLAVQNDFFGHSVTVSGLLTGGDILKHKALLGQYDIVILPGSLLKKDSEIMLDGISPQDIESTSGVPVRVAGGPYDIVRIIKETAGG